MFAKDYSFRGSHAEKVKLLAKTPDESKGKNFKIFNRYMDVYLLAPIVGFLYNKRAEIDKSPGSANILASIMLNNQKELEFNYRLIMLLDKDYEPDFKNRINKAFRDYGNEKSSPDMDRYEEYVRGGIEILYKELVKPSKMPEDYISNLYKFMEEFESRYGQSADEIVDLCRLARS